MISCKSRMKTEYREEDKMCKMRKKDQNSNKKQDTIKDQNPSRETDTKKVQRYTSLYMSLGMCFGLSMGLIYGQLLSPDNISLGMCMGISVGMCIGLAIGSAKDKRLSAHMMQVSRIEEIEESADLVIYAVDENGTEKEYRVNEKAMKEQKFAPGSRVAEETDGTLVSLEEE